MIEPQVFILCYFLTVGSITTLAITTLALIAIIKIIIEQWREYNTRKGGE